VAEPSKATVLIAGGAGYIGSHAVLACLEAGLQVVVLDDLSAGRRSLVPPAARFVEGDVGDAALVDRLIREAGIKALMDFAGSIVVPESVTEPAKYYRNNTVNSLGLFEAAIEAGVTALIYSSTAAVYGDASDAPLAEDSPLSPASPYGRSKLAAEFILKDLCAASDARHAILRYFNVAGADPQGRSGQVSERATHLIKVACEVAAGKRPILPIYGIDYPTPDGSCVRDYIHVSDLAELHVLALKRLLAGGESFTANCGYGVGTSVLEVVAALERVLGRPLPTEIHGRRPGDPPSLVADSSRIRALLDWRPKLDDLDGIVATAHRWEQMS
jgi:UDP-glucose 4-epimerase